MKANEPFSSKYRNNKHVEKKLPPMLTKGKVDDKPGRLHYQKISNNAFNPPSNSLTSTCRTTNDSHSSQSDSTIKVDEEYMESTDTITDFKLQKLQSHQGRLVESITKTTSGKNTSTATLISVEPFNYTKVSKKIHQSSQSAALKTFPKKSSTETSIEAKLITTEKCSKKFIPKFTAAITAKTKATALKTTASKTTALKPTASKTTATKTTATKTTASKNTAPKTTASKATALKTTTSKNTAPKITASKATALKTTASKITASKTTTSNTSPPKTIAIKSTAPMIAVPKTYIIRKQVAPLSKLFRLDDSEAHIITQSKEKGMWQCYQLSSLNPFSKKVMELIVGEEKPIESRVHRNKVNNKPSKYSSFNSESIFGYSNNFVHKVFHPNLNPFENQCLKLIRLGIESHPRKKDLHYTHVTVDKFPRSFHKPDICTIENIDPGENAIFGKEEALLSITS